MAYWSVAIVVELAVKWGGERDLPRTRSSTSTQLSCGYVGVEDTGVGTVFLQNESALVGYVDAGSSVIERLILGKLIYCGSGSVEILLVRHFLL